MAELTLCKANATGRGAVTPDAHIHITAELPEFPFSPADRDALGSFLVASAAHYDEQARQLEELLHATLPGGTYDRLAGRLLARKATHFAVAHGMGEV